MIFQYVANINGIEPLELNKVAYLLNYGKCEKRAFYQNKIEWRAGGENSRNISWKYFNNESMLFAITFIY